MLMSTKNELGSVFCLVHKIIDLLRSLIRYGDLCLINSGKEQYKVLLEESAMINKI